MCRSIVVLRGDPKATSEEVRNASLQYVRKIAGMRAPSAANQEAFDRAVEEIAQSTQTLLDSLVTRPGAKQPAMAKSRIVAREKLAKAMALAGPR